MKRALLLVLVAATLLLLFIPTPGTNTKVTTNHTTGTDVVDTYGEINRALLLLASAESKRKEVAPTPTLPPSPTSEVTPAPEEIRIAGEITPLAESVPSAEAEPIEEAQPSGESTNPADVSLTAAQTIEGAWITYYDCDVEGFCGATASGVVLTEGGTNERYAACDPDYWSVGTIETNGVNGTKMTIVSDPHGYIWTCVDTGSAVIGPAHWDIWFKERERARRYLNEIGGDHATIKILPH